MQGRWVEKAGQRRRRFYSLTAAGRKVLASQRSTWKVFVEAMGLITGVDQCLSWNARPARSPCRTATRRRRAKPRSSRNCRSTSTTGTKNCTRRIDDADARRMALDELSEAGELAQRMRTLSQSHSPAPIVHGRSSGRPMQRALGGSSLRCASNEKAARLHGCRGPHAWARDRRQHDDLHHRQCRGCFVRCPSRTPIGSFG